PPPKSPFIIPKPSLLTHATAINPQFSSIKFKTLTNMADEGHYQPLRGFNEQHNTTVQQQPSTKSTQLVKAATAVTAGGSLLILSGLVLAGTVIALTVITPLFVIFSPVLVPAVIIVALLTLGFFASGGLGVAAITVLAWIYTYVTGKHPPGADQLDTARQNLINKAREIRDYSQQKISGTQNS
ncbi:stearoyl-CoA 9-desaturase, partial [Lathyrus oleraceus]